MDSTGTSTSTSAAQAWRAVVALLYEASDAGMRRAETDRAAHSLALWADLLGSAAQHLLPAGQSASLDDVQLPADLDRRDFASLVLAVEKITRTHDAEAFPPEHRN